MYLWDRFNIHGYHYRLGKVLATQKRLGALRSHLSVTAVNNLTIPNAVTSSALLMLWRHQPNAVTSSVRVMLLIRDRGIFIREWMNDMFLMALLWLCFRYLYIFFSFSCLMWRSLNLRQLGELQRIIRRTNKHTNTQTVTQKHNANIQTCAHLHAQTNIKTLKQT